MNVGCCILKVVIWFMLSFSEKFHPFFFSRQGVAMFSENSVENISCDTVSCENNPEPLRIFFSIRMIISIVFFSDSSI